MISQTIRATVTHACRSLGRLLRRISSPPRRADNHDGEENWGLLTEEESDKGTAQETQSENFSPSGTIEEDVDPGWVADFTSVPAADNVPSVQLQGRVNSSETDYDLIFSSCRDWIHHFFLIYY